MIHLTIVGINKLPRVHQLVTSSVTLAGRVADLTELYDGVRVFVAPTRYAAGIPHKIHEAAARGVPVVATPLLAAQLGWHDGDPFLVGNDSESFAKKCIELHENRGMWEKLRGAAIERIRKECSAAAFEASVRECLTPA